MGRFERFEKEIDRWTDLSLTRRFWYQDLRLKIQDRQAQHIIFLSSVSAAIFAIVVTLLVSSKSIFYYVSFWFFLVNVLLGAILILISIFTDLKDIDKANKEELDIYRRLRDAAEDVVNHWRDTEKMGNYFKIRQSIVKVLEKKGKRNWLKFVLDILYYIFLVSFFIGLGGLVFSVVN